MNARTYPVLLLAGLAAANAAHAGITVGSTWSLAPGLAPSGVAIADFNADGHGDIACCIDAPGGIRLMLGSATGTFILGGFTSLGANAGAGEIVAGDFDGNGSVDLAVILKNQGAVRILANNGAGVFTTLATLATGEDGSGPSTGDLDSDGDLDMVVANSAVDTVSVLRNNGGGSFTVIELAAGADPRGATFGDFDGNGTMDIASTAHDDRTLVLFRNKAGSFAPWTTIPISNLMRPQDAKAADLNNDGRTDLAVAAKGDAGSYLLTYLAGKAGLGAANTLAVPGGGAIQLALGDLDCDGDVDAAMADAHGNRALLAENAGDGTFGNPVIVNAGLNTVAVAIGDLDGAMSLDVAAVASDDDSLTVALTACVVAVPGDLDGDGMVGGSDLTILLAGWGQPGPSDLDGDGNTSASDLTILLANWG
jgi:hypothetical protein